MIVIGYDLVSYLLHYQVLFTGTPEEMVKAKTKSYTAPFLKDELKSDKK